MFYQKLKDAKVQFIRNEYSSVPLILSGCEISRFQLVSNLAVDLFILNSPSYLVCTQ